MSDVAKDTSSPTEPSPPEPKLSSKGISAMQGSGDLPSLAEANEPDLEAAARCADQQVPEHIANHAGERVEFYKIRGRIGEELAADNMPGSINLNDATGKSNFTNYDVASPYEMASVKVEERDENGQPHYANYNK